MTSLHHLSPRWQFERSGEVSAGITTAISDILERVNSHSVKGTKLAAIRALISIGVFMMTSMDGEIGKCIQNDYTPTELSNAVAKVVHMMDKPLHALEVLQDLKDLDDHFQPYGIDAISGIVGEVEEMEREEGDEEEESD
ncbi:hypothetical protein RQP46_009723 [Phenoliferia psychrophenolica]